MTAVWWQWLLAIPVSDGPSFDETGANAFVGQPYYSGQGDGDLLFLAGVSNASGTAHRAITVKQGTAFFFPILNTEWDNVGATKHLGAPEPGPAYSIPELRAIAASNEDGATGLSATLTPMDSEFEEATGCPQDVCYTRLQSKPFNYKLPETDNIYQFFGLDISGTVAPAVSDGYWSFISGDALAPGNYRLDFTGTSPDGSFTLSITYDITVTP
jgi:hypothetical protein